MSEQSRHPASFKDPSGFVFTHEGRLFRQINEYYASDYRLLNDSGLYDILVSQGLLVAHTEIDDIRYDNETWFRTIEPRRVEFISYPYEWCFEQLKDAALLTLRLLRVAVSKGMIIKDATPYNIQFMKGRPLHIDSLSFERYDPTQPWVAYRQFCNLFLFPLYLEYYLKADIQKTLATYLDGIPVEITSRLLPLKSSLNLGVWLHVYLQHSMRTNAKSKTDKGNFSKKRLLHLVSHLETIISGFQNRQLRSNWSHYYQESILSTEYLSQKEKIVMDIADQVSADTVIDLGANDGHFSKLFAKKFRQVIAVDSDSRSISNLYLHVQEHKIKNILPLVIDLSNPSPALGFANNERSSFTSRCKPDLVLCLALIHHLVIGKNIPLHFIADYFASFAPQLIIEFVPKQDEKVKQMLKTRKDVFMDYDKKTFENSFGRHYEFKRKELVEGTFRTIYQMVRKY
jgi:2-polyprenyl-3-methyl-5-hydroxy-6-metoxy-1,4-benzoquinol methylase